MATTSRTTYTHTCDLCGAEHPRGELHGLGLVGVHDATPGLRPPEIEGPQCDVCPACRERPVADLLAFLEERKAERDQSRRAPNVAAYVTRP